MNKLTYDELTRSRLSEQDAALPQNRFPVILILDNIRSMYNVGSIFRTADGARVEAIYTAGYTPHPPRDEITKTALGATKTIPHKHFATVTGAIAGAKELDFGIAALEVAHGARSVFELNRDDFPLAIIIGNEISGVSREAMALADFAIEIPMLGAKHSLNAAVSAGIVLFECVRLFKDQFEEFKP